MLMMVMVMDMDAHSVMPPTQLLLPGRGEGGGGICCCSMIMPVPAAASSKLAYATSPPPPLLLRRRHRVHAKLQQQHRSSHYADKIIYEPPGHIQTGTPSQPLWIEMNNNTQPYVVTGNAQTLASRLQGVTTLAQGKRIHEHMMKSVAEEDSYLANLLISMYSRFGDLQSACTVFNKLRYPSVVSWNCIITAYTKNQLPKEALQIFRKMLQKGHKPNRVTFLVILGACSSPGNLAEGKWIHAYVVKEGFKRDIAVCNALITMYSTCGDLKEATSGFHRMQKRNLISWNSAIAAYCKHGEEKKALDLFLKMEQLHIKPDRCTFLSLLGVFTSPESLTQGKEIHNCILDHGFNTEVSICNALINMYNKCGALDEAFLVFKQMPERDVISWTSMIDAYSHHGFGSEALKTFEEMQQKSIKPNKATFLSIIHACSDLANFEKGKAVHSILKQNGVPIDSQLGNSLICMYGKCNAVQYAQAVFDKMQSHDAVSWTNILHAYASNECAEEALQLFKKLQRSDIEPSISHYISALDACGTVCNLEEGKILHLHVSNRGFMSDIRIGNALISMYSKCGALSDACIVFDSMQEHDVVSWNAIISAHGKEGNSEEAFNCYLVMQDHGLDPNRLTFLGLLSACTSSAALDEGRIIHTRILEYGLDLDNFLGNSLINMYGNCGAKKDARYVFDQMNGPDVASWNAMLAAYCHSGDGMGAVEFFKHMKEHAKPDKFSFLSMLRACIILEAPDMGKEIHASIKHCGLEADVTIGAALINMYGKCKALKEACDLFERMANRDMPTFAAMIDAYSHSGCYKDALQVFDVMQKNYCQPNRSMLVRIIASFNTPAAIEVGKEIHSYIIENGFEGHVLVGNALVTMYGNFRELECAQQVFNRMVQHDIISWTTMMNIHLKFNQDDRVLELYKQIQKELVSLDKVAFFTLLYACTNLKALKEGRIIHNSIIDAGYGSDVDVRRALRKMYGTCDASEELSTL